MNDDDSSLDEIEKIIPSPKINKNTKDLFSEEDDSKFDLDLKNNNLDNFGDISQINNDQENSLIINNKNSKLSSTNENTENSKKNKISEEIIKNSNDFNCFYFNNIQSNRIKTNKDYNNEKKYRILFDKNKKLNLNSLREEYNKIKKENNTEYKPYNYNKKYICIFNDNNKKFNSNLSNLYLNISNNKRRQNRNIVLNTNNEHEENISKFNFKTNHNSKQKDPNEKIRNFKIQFFEENNKNNTNIFSAIKNTEKPANEKKAKNNFWNNKYISNKKNINNISINTRKPKEKKIYIFEEYKANSLSNNNIIKNSKSTIIEYNSINSINNNKNQNSNLFNKYNKLCNDLLSFEKSKIKINPIISFNKISEDTVEKLDDDLNKMFNMVEKKIRQNKIDIKINEENQRYYLKNKNRINKIIPKLLSISQNENLGNYLIKHKNININNRNNLLNNNFKFIRSSNLNTQLNQAEIRPSRINYKQRLNNYLISDFSMN